MVNPALDSYHLMLAQIEMENESRWEASVKLESVDIVRGDYQTYLKDLLAEADAVFCTTPTLGPSFTAQNLDG